MTDMRLGIDVAAAIDGRLDMDALAKTPVAFDHRVGCIDAVDDDGHAGAAGNHDVGTVARRKAVSVVPIKMASASPARMIRSPGFSGNLTERREAKG